jgi:23S rRNA pseudouridine1911/1915/1917 synthase
MQNIEPIIDVIADEDDYIVLNKPAGLLAHPPYENFVGGTLVDWLIKQYPGIKSVGDNPRLRPGIVHRLDALVSGLMVVAKTQEMFVFLKDQFKTRKVLKEYTALAYGRIEREEGEITVPLKKGPGRTIVKPRGAQREKGVLEAITRFEVLDHFQHYTLVKVFLHTGRTHQIRAHFYAYNHSLVGDKKYCHRQYRTRSAFTRFVKSDRVFLHASRLVFMDRNGEMREYTSPLPEELQGFLETISR